MDAPPVSSNSQPAQGETEASPGRRAAHGHTVTLWQGEDLRCLLPGLQLAVCAWFVTEPSSGRSWRYIRTDRDQPSWLHEAACRLLGELGRHPLGKARLTPLLNPCQSPAELSLAGSVLSAAPKGLQPSPQLRAKEPAPTPAALHLL